MRSSRPNRRLAPVVATAIAAVAWIATVPCAPGAAGDERREWSMPAIADDDASADDRSVPAIAVDPAGAVHAAWVTTRDGRGTLEYSVLEPGAATWAPARPVAPTGAGGARSDPSIAVDSYDAVHVVWLGYEGGRTDVWHAVMARNDAFWSIPARVDDDHGVAARWDPEIAGDLAGNVHVLWVGFGDGSPDIRHRRRSPDGAWTASVRVNDSAAGDQLAPALALTPGGDLVAVWQDTRHGRSEVFSSRLPQYGDVWWPNADLSAVQPAPAHRAPVVAADGHGTVAAVWLDDSVSPVGLRWATLRPDDPARPYWVADRPLYAPGRGDVLSASVSGGSGQIAATWTELRAASTRVYAGVVSASGALAPERIDGATWLRDGTGAAVGVSPLAEMHVLWRGLLASGLPHVFHSVAALAPAAAETVEARGWLQYVPVAPNCGGDAFVLVACDGTPGALLRPGGADPSAVLGHFVRVSGVWVGRSGCRHIAVRSIVRDAPPCPRDTGALSGVITSDGRPVEGAQVHMGAVTVPTGRSGRFFFDRVSPGPVAISATAGCALTIALEGLNVPRETLVNAPPAVLVRADAAADCRVDVLDLMHVARAYKTLTTARTACADLDADGVVGMTDLVRVAAHYGRRCPMPWQGPPPAAR